MDVEAIKDAIAHLSGPERRQLAEWFGELQEDEWDRQMANDFAAGGSGAHLVARIDREIDHAIATESVAELAEGLRSRRAQRAKK